MILFLILPIVSAFTFRCPDPSQRRYKADEFCTSKFAYQYFCLLDKNSNKFTENCTQNVDFVRPGKKYVIEGVPTDSDCSPDRYQPFLFYLNVYSECVFLKSSCIDDGQIISSNGSTKGDRTCRCDSTRGYDYVTQPKDKCHCIPSQEDCSCYIRHCPERFILSPDFECIPNDTVHRTFICKDIIVSAKPNQKDTHIEQLAANNFSAQRNGLRIYVTLMTVAGVLTIVIVFTGLNIHLVIQSQKIELDAGLFEMNAIGHWKELKELLNNPDNILCSMKKKGLVTSGELEGVHKLSPNKKKNFLLVRLIKNVRNEDKLKSCTNIIEEQGLQVLKIFNGSPPRVRRWPKRNIDLCRQKLSDPQNFYTYVDPHECIDDFLQHFIFDIDNFEQISSCNTRTSTVDCFLEAVVKTLHKGSFECMLDVLGREEEFAIPYQCLRKSLHTGIKLNFENGTLYPNCEGSKDIHDFLLSVKELTEDSGLHLKPATLSCEQMIWLIGELGLYPKRALTNESILCVPLVDDCLQRLTHCIKNEIFDDFLELIFIYEVRDMKKNTEVDINIQIIINTDEPTTENSKEDEIDISSVNTISANMSYLRRFIDVKRLEDIFKQEGSTIFEQSQQNSHQEDTFLDVLENNINPTLLRQFLYALRLMGNNNVLRRLETFKRVYSAQTDNLPQHILSHIKDICYETCDDVDDIINILLERHILEKELEELFTSKKKNMEKMLALIINILESKRGEAMLAFIDALHYNESHSKLADSLLTARGNVRENKVENRDKLMCKTEKGVANIFFEGNYRLHVTS